MITRLKKIRETFGINKSELASKVRMTPSSISLIESGKRPVTDRLIHTICTEFGVDEHWLRTGEGDMYALPSEEDAELIELLARLNADDMDIDRKRLAVSFCRLVMELPRPALTPAADLCNQLADALKQKKDED